MTVVQNNLIYECQRIRERAGVSQRTLADQAGVSHTSIQRWERGRWGEEAVEIIAAYVALMPRPDEAAIWKAAVKNWHTPVPGSPMSPDEGVTGEAEVLLRRRRKAVGR